MSACIECGCDDDHACPGGCSWIRLEADDEIGVCSACPGAAARWDAGDRDFTDRAMDAVVAHSYVGLEDAATERELLLPGDAEFAETFRYLRGRRA
jgi:hypothetical protein